MLAANGDDRAVVVGYDTRFVSERFTAAVAEVFAGNGLRVLLADRPAPTPAIGYNLVAREAGSGVVITASHNPPEWNGYKFKPDYGGSASPEIVAELERHVGNAERQGQPKITPLAEGVKSGLVEYFDPGASVSGKSRATCRSRQDQAGRSAGRGRFDARLRRGILGAARFRREHVACGAPR